MSDVSFRSRSHGYTAFWLGLLSLILCAPLGLAAITLGAVELRCEQDRGYAIMGIVLGCLGLLWPVFFITVVLLSQR